MKQKLVGSGKAEDPLGKYASLRVASGSLGLCVPGSPGLGMLTVAIFLGWVGDQPAVVRARGHQIWDAIVVIIIITFITDPILVSVQLGTVDDGGAVVCAVLVAVPVTAGQRLV